MGGSKLLMGSQAHASCDGDVLNQACVSGSPDEHTTRAGERFREGTEGS